MWQKVAKFKGAEYFRKALYLLYLSYLLYLLLPTISTVLSTLLSTLSTVLSTISTVLSTISTVLSTISEWKKRDDFVFLTVVDTVKLSLCHVGLL